MSVQAAVRRGCVLLAPFLATLATGTVTQTRSVPRREVPVILIAFEDSMFETLNEERPNEAVTSDNDKEQVKLQAVETIQRAFADWEIRVAKNTPAAVRALAAR